MKWLTTLFGNGQRWETAVTAAGTTQELPYRHVAELLWWYFLNNGLYEELRRLGYFLQEESLKGVRNPAQRVVKFYADTIWPGPLDKALPLELESNTQIEEAIQNAIAKAGKSVRNMRWFEVVETRGHIEEGAVAHYQVTLKIGFTLD